MVSPDNTQVDDADEALRNRKPYEALRMPPVTLADAMVMFTEAIVGQCDDGSPAFDPGWPTEDAATHNSRIRRALAEVLRAFDRETRTYYTATLESFEPLRSPDGPGDATMTTERDKLHAHVYRDIMRLTRAHERAEGVVAAVRRVVAERDATSILLIERTSERDGYYADFHAVNAQMAGARMNEAAAIMQRDEARAELAEIRAALAEMTTRFGGQS